MGVAEFIGERFLGKEIIVSCGENAETLTFDQNWLQNKEFVRGTVEEVYSNVLVLNVPENGLIYINCDQIFSFWRPGFEYNKAVQTSLTRKLFGSNRG